MDRILPIVVLFLSTIILFFVILARNNTREIESFEPATSPPPVPMPVIPISEIDTSPVEQQSEPVPHRTNEFIRYLATAVKLSTPNSSASGTIIHYDPATNKAYVLSCGHLWSGDNRNPSDTINIQTWYTNRRLLAPRTYQGEVLFYTNSRTDLSLIRFTPDWVPRVAHIAPLDTEISNEATYHSLGADRGSEVARYGVRIARTNERTFVTRFNTPRPGRSGGGLLTSDGLIIGVCSARDSRGFGYFVNLSAIHTEIKHQGYEYLLEQSPQMYIRDHTNPGREYDNRIFVMPRFFLAT